jgi:hypothetical protein
VQHQKFASYYAKLQEITDNCPETIWYFERRKGMAIDLSALTRLEPKLYKAETQALATALLGFGSLFVNMPTWVELPLIVALGWVVGAVTVKK